MGLARTLLQLILYNFSFCDFLPLKSSSAPEFPEPHGGKDEGKTKEEVFKWGGGDASSDNSSFVVHHDCFPIGAVMGEPPIRH